jgi:hypothetical protein
VNLEKLAESFRQDIAKEESLRKDKQEITFARKAFGELGVLVGASKGLVRKFVNDSQDDLAYDLKYKYPELSHFDVTGSCLSDWKHLFLPVREWPNGLWERYLQAINLASNDYGQEIAALVFRVKLTPWIMTNETLPLPQLTPVITVTTKSNLPEIRVLPLKGYVKIMEKNK